MEMGSLSSSKVRGCLLDFQEFEFIELGPLVFQLPLKFEFPLEIMAQIFLGLLEQEQVIFKVK